MESLASENRELKRRVAELEEQLHERQSKRPRVEEGEADELAPVTRLSNGQIIRYSRQLLVPSFGVEGQKQLLSKKILVVGCGGLGSIVSMYLAGAGVGCLGLVDFDTVQRSNLHRQVIHTEAGEGRAKVTSAKAFVQRLNSEIRVVAHSEKLTADNAMQLVRAYDVVVDASDNPGTRYLINDACVLAGKPLVSGSAVGIEGQVTVYNYRDGPCYRCLYPNQPVRGSVKRCDDGGVLGPVPGLIGCVQALQAMKVAAQSDETLCGSLLMFDGSDTSFRRFRFSRRREKCAVCGAKPSITSISQSGRSVSCAVCESSSSPPSVSDADVPAVTCSHLQSVRSARVQSTGSQGGAAADVGAPSVAQGHLLLDVREPHQIAICALPNSFNVPLHTLEQSLATVRQHAEGKDIYVICRRGIDSAAAVRLLLANGFDKSRIFNVEGGLAAWSRVVDPQFPVY